MALKSYTNLEADAAKTDARLRRKIIDIPSGDTVYMELYWPNVDATTVDALYLGTSPAGTFDAVYSSPKADGQAYSGDWTCGKLIIEAENDRSVTIVLPLYDSTTNYSKTFTAYYTNQHQTRTIKLYQGLTETAVQTVLASYDEVGETAVNTQTVIDFNRNKNTGLFDLRVVLITFDEASTSKYDAVKGKGYSVEKTVYRRKPAAPTMAGVTYGSLHYSENDMGSFDGVLTETTYDSNATLGYSSTNGFFYGRPGSYTVDADDKTYWKTDYHATEQAAFDAIDEGLAGSRVDRVLPVLWRSFKLATTTFA